MRAGGMRGSGMRAGGMRSGSMRHGVPRPQGSSVVTIHDEGAAVRDFVGDRGALVTHATLLDAGGVVRCVEAGGWRGSGCPRRRPDLARGPVATRCSVRVWPRGFPTRATCIRQRR